MGMVGLHDIDQCHVPEERTVRRSPEPGRFLIVLPEYVGPHPNWFIADELRNCFIVIIGTIDMYNIGKARFHNVLELYEVIRSRHDLDTRIVSMEYRQFRVVIAEKHNRALGLKPFDFVKRVKTRLKAVRLKIDIHQNPAFGVPEYFFHRGDGVLRWLAIM